MLPLSLLSSSIRSRYLRGRLLLRIAPFIIACAGLLLPSLLVSPVYSADAAYSADSAPGPNSARGPNIVVILADDLGYGDVSCYGAKLVDTPRIDRLAKEGRRFTDAHTPSSVCTPTRYGLLTGRYCWRTSLQRETLSPAAPLLIEPTRTTIASLLKKRGYATAAIGKWHLGYGTAAKADFDKPLSPGPLDLGFDDHFAVPQNHGDFLRCYIEGDHVAGRQPGEHFEPLGPGKWPRGLAKPRVDDQVNQVLTEKAVAWLDKAHGQPFFLYFAPVAVHAPITPHAQFRGASKCGLYGDYIRELDWCVGQILAALDRHKLAENTLVIFTSDNGAVSIPREARESLLNLADDEGGAVSQHYRTAWKDALAAGHKACGDFRGMKASIYEGGTRVPFIVRWPGRVPAGSSSDELICLTDVLSTVAGIMGDKLPRDAGEDSYDIGPALCGKRPSRPIREALVMHNVEGVFAIRQGKWKYVAAGHAPGSRKNSPMTKEGDQAQLYNLESDPAETTNVLAEHSDIGARLAALLERYRRQGHSRPSEGSGPSEG
jgi:arylsulfatase A-like enzyme